MFSQPLSQEILLIDTHCHLDAPQFAKNRDEIVAEAIQYGVKQYIIPGITAKSWQQLISIAERYEGAYAAPGLHPLFTEQHEPEQLTRLEALLNHEKVIAIGEIGLDYYHGEHDKKQQLFYLEQQLLLAQKYKNPILLHVRKAHDHVISRLRKMQFTPGGIVHAFSGSLQQAEKYLDCGFYIGVGGAATFPRATKLHKTIRSLPLESLVLESDAPYMTPYKCATETNIPQYIYQTATCIAQLKGITTEQVAEATTANVQQLLTLTA